MNNKQLQYAVALSKSLNFSQVAKNLGISQPALSKQILKLEKELGVELFDRKQTPIALTAAGDYFFSETKDLLYREEQLYMAMNDFKEGKKGRLTIGVSPFRALYLLPDLCKKVKVKFPDVQIILQEDSSDKLRSKTVEGKYDFAIVNLPVNESMLDTVRIQEDTLVLVVPNSSLHLINGSKTPMSEIDFKNCEKLPFVVVRKKQEMRQLFDKICAKENMHPFITMEVVGLTTAWAMANNGIGATLLPLQFVEKMGYGENVSLFIPKCQYNIRQPVIIMRQGQYLSEYAKYAIDVLTRK